MRVLILGLQQDWIWTDKRIEMTTSEIRSVNEAEACCQRLMTIPGIWGVSQLQWSRQSGPVRPMTVRATGLVKRAALPHERRRKGEGILREQ